MDKKLLFHGSIVPNIKTLNPISKLHDSNDHIVYLTANAPYALFYIWDGRHNKKEGKHITAWVKNGIAHYEEQFPDQMKKFYDGVKGYLYSVCYDESMNSVTNREMMYSCKSEVEVESVRFVENVYTELLKYEAEGKLKVVRFEDVPQDRIIELYEYMAKRIVDNHVLACPDGDEAVFYKTYFGEVWRMVEKYNAN